MPTTSWKAEFYVDAYELARSGLTDMKIARALGIKPDTLYSWKKSKPAFARAIERGRTAGTQSEGLSAFHDYVNKQLPPELMDLWDEIQAVRKEKNAIVRMEAIFAKRGLRARQHLFLHALSSYNFNKTKAATAVGISPRTVETWVNTDPNFGELMRVMADSQGSFFEECLVKSCKRGETAAIIFANKTFNKGRGYGEKIDVAIGGSVDVNHKVTLVEELDLPIEMRKVLLDKLREKQERDNALEGTVRRVIASNQ
jgi:hypothetical protein